jgi:hypothetical protein
MKICVNSVSSGDADDDERTTAAGELDLHPVLCG